MTHSIEEEETGEERKHRVPVPVTTPRRGPLVLRVGQKEAGKGVGVHTQSQLQGSGHRMFLLPRKPARHSLTRYPVVMVQRPLQQIEANLGHLSCAALQDSIHYLLPSAKTKKVMLPHLHPMMKYSPLNNGIHGNHMAPPPAMYTEGDIGISITYSRHSQQQQQQQQRPTPPLSHTLTTHTHTPTRQDGSQLPLPLGHSTLNPSSLPPSHNTLPSAALQAPQGTFSDSYVDSQKTRDWERHLRPQQITIVPRSSLLVPPTSGTSLAPPSLQAVVTHRRKPLTQHTMLRGRRMLT